MSCRWIVCLVICGFYEGFMGLDSCDAEGGVFLVGSQRTPPAFAQQQGTRFLGEACAL